MPAPTRHSSVRILDRKPCLVPENAVLVDVESTQNHLYGNLSGVERKLAKTFPLAYRGESVYLTLGNRGEPVSKPSDLVQGTLDLLLLKILALQPMNGWAISQRLKQVSGDVLQVSDGSLYPALHKLEQEGWITAEWKQTENNRRAKFYSLTRLGRQHLEKEAANWSRLSAAISQVVRLEEA
jgi:PadR family transcriptional regulator, regulatory protein PadR